jgi:hypothetical protein
MSIEHKQQFTLRLVGFLITITQLFGARTCRLTSSLTHTSDKTTPTTFDRAPKVISASFWRNFSRKKRFDIEMNNRDLFSHVKSNALTSNEIPHQGQTKRTKAYEAH